MSLPRYSEYKASGVEWLGEVPGHWNVKRVGYYFDERREKVSDKDFEALSVTKNGVVPQLDTAAKTDDGDNRKKVCKGDFVINSRSDRKGSSGASLLDGSVSLINTVLNPKEEVEIQFFHHLFRSHPFQEEYYRYGKGIVADLWSTNYSEMKNINLAVPSIKEQQTIAAFLDRETGKIDALIAEQRRLVELLAEKRQAVISHAVTKGLNPNAKMKDSGIEWLGEVPATWNVSQLRYSVKTGTSITYGIVQAGPHIEDGIPYIRTSDMSGQSLPLDGYAKTSKEIDSSYARSKVYAGDLVIAIRATVGKCLPLPDDLDGANLTQGTAKISPGEELSKGYLLGYINSSGVQTYLNSMAKGATFKEITLGVLRKTPVLVPPIAEQQEIASFIDTETAKFDTLTAEANRAIALLQERRSALISAAVTGKIDVCRSGFIPTYPKSRAEARPTGV